MCHAWSCTPTALLSEEVLGVTYDARKKTVTFEPNTIGLVWAQGIAPLTCGDITARWEIKDGLLNAKLATPRDIQVEVNLPGKDGAEATLNGRKQPAKLERGRFRLGLRGGDYEIAVPQA